MFTGERRPDIRGRVSLQEGVKDSERVHGLVHRLDHGRGTRLGRHLMGLEEDGRVTSLLRGGRECVKDVALAREDQVHGALHASGVDAAELDDAERRSRRKLLEDFRVNLLHLRVAE